MSDEDLKCTIIHIRTHTHCFIFLKLFIKFISIHFTYTLHHHHPINQCYHSLQSQSQFNHLHPNVSKIIQSHISSHLFTHSDNNHSNKSLIHHPMTFSSFKHSYFIHTSWALTLAFASNSTCATSVFPTLAAKWRGVLQHSCQHHSIQLFFHYPKYHKKKKTQFKCNSHYSVDPKIT
jgi:hypothetical protein